MTDEEFVDGVFALFEARRAGRVTLRRNGRILLALPSGRRGALRALGLYQPQSAKARLSMAMIGLAAGMGLHRWFLPSLGDPDGIVAAAPDCPKAVPRTTGILLGSPEHRVRRAIASYEADGGWEVAKISYGEEGAEVLAQEARILEDLAVHAEGIPRLLGLHRGEGVTLLRMPYLTGKPIAPGRQEEALRLLNRWISPTAPKSACEFPEWPAMQSALENHPAGNRALERLSRECLRPVIRHGDFARWNLRRSKDGSLVALDWEWGHPQGMPGIDLTHFFLQDDRLVRRHAPAEAIRCTLASLQSTACHSYLAETGWSGDALLPVIAGLAWKQGAAHQENRTVLEAALAALR